MITLLLIRHAMCDPVGRLIAGRARGVHLNEEGRAQAARLAERLRGVTLDGVVSSPLERAVETAEPIARQAGLAVEAIEQLNEIDFGAWTGCTLTALDQLDDWRRFNVLRSVSRPLGGESMLDVQARAVRAVETLRKQHPDGICAVVSHGDVIRSLVAHFAGIPLDLFQRLEISPASVSTVALGKQEIAIRVVNSMAGPVYTG
jgi:probable phosphoglycerate mutase